MSSVRRGHRDRLCDARPVGFEGRYDYGAIGIRRGFGEGADSGTLMRAASTT